MPKVRTALLESSLDEPADVQPRPVATLMDEAEHVERLCAQSAYGAFGQRLPELLRELHVVATTSSSTIEREQALRALVRAYHATFYLLKDLGYLDLAHIAVHHARDAARRLGDPAVNGLAAFVRVHALIPAGIYTAALSTARRAMEQVRPHLEDRTVAEVYGMLNLSAALICTTISNEPEANAHLDEAQRAAERTGEGNAFGLHFGPTNVAVWRVALLVEMGKGADAAQTAENVRPELIDSKGRQATFYADWGRALAQLKGRERDAISRIRQAEKLAPEQTRNNPLVREAVAHLLHRTRAQLPASVASDLRRLAYRMGLGAPATR